MRAPVSHPAARPYLGPVASPRDNAVRAALNASPTRPYVPSALAAPPPYSPRILSPRALAPRPPSPCASPRPASPGPASPRPMLTKVRWRACWAAVQDQARRTHTCLKLE